MFLALLYKASIVFIGLKYCCSRKSIVCATPTKTDRRRSPAAKGGKVCRPSYYRRPSGESEGRSRGTPGARTGKARGEPVESKSRASREQKKSGSCGPAERPRPDDKDSTFSENRAAPLRRGKNTWCFSLLSIDPVEKCSCRKGTGRKSATAPRCGGRAKREHPRSPGL